jgi:asparagine synthase (glutamine-hydrolysing)
MCGIAGIISETYNTKEIILKMTDSLAKRGPDDIGVFMGGNVALGHRRLSVIDLISGQQPMSTDDGKKVVVFNGEIYNFLKVRDELILKGLKFSTNSDTEVIIKGYEYYGLLGILERIEGMFAFALWDVKLNKLFLVRDRFGEKPLYYLNHRDGFFFASELKALKPFIDNAEVDADALNLFLTLTYIPAPYSIYKSVKKLMPGQVLEVSSMGEFATWQYHTLSKEVNEQKKYDSYTAAKKDLRELLLKSVKQRMISDVPLGAFLSGGIDSSIVSALMTLQSQNPINTFSIGFMEKEYDETDRSNLVSKHIGSNHTSFKVTHEDLLQIADDVIDYFDEPFADSSALPSFIVAQKARQKVTVVLTGDCADELFGGYEKYLSTHYVNKFNTLPLFVQKLIRKSINAIPHSRWTNHILRKLKKVLGTSKLSPLDRHYRLMSLGFDDFSRKELVKGNLFREVRPFVKEYFEGTQSGDELDRGFFTDVNLVLEGDMLTKVDRMCMMNSLEARVPFLDSAIVHASFRMPSSYKIKGTNKKRILKDAFSDLLPAKVFSFGKKGFGIPIALWFRNELRDELLNVLDKESIEKFGLLNFEYVSKLIDEHQSGKQNHSSKLWTLYVFQKWCKKNL